MKTMNAKQYEGIVYFHAGASAPGAIEWSTLTHETYDAAETEAREMAERTGTRGVVEYWSRDHGTVPGDCEAVLGADWVEGDEETAA